MQSSTNFIQNFVSFLEQQKSDIKKEFLTTKDGFKEILALDCTCYYPKFQKEVSLPISLFQYRKIPVLFIIYQNMNELINEERRNIVDLREKDLDKKMNKLQEIQNKRIFSFYESEEKRFSHYTNFESVNTKIFLFSDIIYKILSEDIPKQCKYYLNNEEIPEYQAYSTIFYAVNHPENFKKE